MNSKLKEFIDEKIDINSDKSAWLNLEQSDIEGLENPLIPKTQRQKDNFHLHVLKIMRNPKYFWWTAKVLLNIDLLPEQVVIIQQLWNHTFPMYIASRGFGKATTLVSEVHCENGPVQMGDIKLGDKVYGRDGNLHKVTAIHPQGKKQVYRVNLYDGRSVDCCEDHLWVVLDKANKAKEKTLSTKQIFSTKIKIGANRPYYRYYIPNCDPVSYSTKEQLIDPYILGCLLGNGDMKSATPRIASDDDFIIKEFENRLNGFELHKDYTNNNYAIVDCDKVKEEVVHGRTGTVYLAKTRNRLTSKIKKLKLNVGCKDKFIPDCYKYGSIEQRMELIRGLLDTDGSINNDGSIEFTNSNEKLIKDIMFVLRSLGIRCQSGIDDRSDEHQLMPQGTIRERTPYFRVYINTSKDVFKLPRKLSRIKKIPTEAEKYVPIVSIEKLDEYQEMQCITVDNPDHTYLTNDYTVTHNSYLLAVYSTLRCLLIPETKIVVAGAAFRQAKVIFDYMETIWNNAPILRSICSESSGPRRDVDRCTMRINDSWTIAIPLGDGNKIRGLRAHTIICDEFNSVPVEIYETVLSGFTSVSKDPINNVKEAAARKRQKQKGTWNENKEKIYTETRYTNQSIISGTAGYDFEPFADYWKKYKKTIETQSVTSEGDEMPEYMKALDPTSFTIVRIPFEIIPEGFMSAATVARSRATMHVGTYLTEYAACFAKDSLGFYRRTLIDGCTAHDKNIASQGWPEWCSEPFDPIVRGDPRKQYVFGVDPASEVDNFAIAVVELHDNHQRLVYIWTTNRKDFNNRKKIGLTNADDYYTFCVRKIRDLMLVFPCSRIGIDTQGGGYQIVEGLGDANKMNKLFGEQPILPIIEEGKEKETDALPGQHIIEFISFASAEWTSNANHGLRKDMEDKFILFPRFDSLSLSLVSAEDEIVFKQLQEKFGDNNSIRLYDTLEDCTLEIEELKSELATISMTRTSNGRERFDTPEIKMATGKKGRLRKDRYSALLIANMLARSINRSIVPPTYNTIARIATPMMPTGIKKGAGNMFNGPDWMKSYNPNTIKIVRRG